MMCKVITFDNIISTELKRREAEQPGEKLEERPTYEPSKSKGKIILTRESS